MKREAVRALAEARADKRNRPVDHQAEWQRHAAGMPSYRGDPLARLFRVK